jgi:divalent metal cation (Fe/Co/Zn/Cd) transporter
MERKPKTILAAMAANVVIAGAKFAAAFFSGSSRCWPKGFTPWSIPATAACCFLGCGGAGVRQNEDHLFGHGKELYFWTLVVAMLIFVGGGIASAYHGILRLRNPRPLDHLLSSYIILGISAVCEGYSLRVAYREFRRSPGNDSEEGPKRIPSLLEEAIRKLLGAKGR